MPHSPRRYYFLLRRPDDVYDLASIIASFSPNPDHTLTGVYELLINAIEHGNLGIGFLLKNNLLRQGTWQQEIERRLESPEHTDKTVRIEVVEDESGSYFTIADEGSGFNWEGRLAEDSMQTEPHGRGLIIAMQAGFESIRFNDDGNAVTCRFRSAAAA